MSRLGAYRSGGDRLREPYDPAGAALMGYADPQRHQRSVPLRLPRAPERVWEGVTMILDAAVYADGRRVAYATVEGALRARHKPNGFAAVALHEPDQDELASLAGELRLSETITENAIKRPPRASIQRYGNLLSIWLASVRYPDGEEGVRIGWICVLLEGSLLVALSFGEGLDELRDVMRPMVNESEQLWESPWDVLRETMRAVFDDYDRAVDNLDGDVAQAERDVFDGKPTAARRIHALTRVVVELHQTIEPLAEALDRFLESADAEAHEVFVQARHRIRRVTEKLDGFRDVLSSLLGLNLTMVGQKISAWGAILIVPTVIAGIFGMNFEKEHWWTQSRHGFELLVVLMIVVSVLLYLRFKRSGWL
jgi:magnesium transporter